METIEYSLEKENATGTPALLLQRTDELYYANISVRRAILDMRF